jgi:polynucleotide 5'-kinase involved in rRNA processing
MSFEYHHLDKFGFANLDLCEEMLESEKKAIVLISGASSSGKSFSAELLKDLLDHNGHHAVIVSLDQYDYGLSGIIPNKVALNDFQNHLRKPFRNRKADQRHHYRSSVRKEIR